MFNNFKYHNNFGNISNIIYARISISIDATETQNRLNLLEW